MLDRYAVFGNPIEHSLSPYIHTTFAKATQQQLSYGKELIEEDAFESSVEQFFASGGKGLNITLPFKLRAYSMARHITTRARAAGAANTLYIKDSLLCADNTDGVGLLRDMREYLQWQLAAARVLLIGAGGASRGVLLPLLEAGVKEIVIVNRTVSKAQALVGLFKAQLSAEQELTACGFDSLRQQSAFNIIINASSASLAEQMLDVSPNILSSSSCCYDMAYQRNRQATIFMRWAHRHGAMHTADGLGMLLEQAAEAFYIWRGVRPSTTALRSGIAERLTSS